MNGRKYSELFFLIRTNVTKIIYDFPPFYIFGIKCFQPGQVRPTSAPVKSLSFSAEVDTERGRERRGALQLRLMNLN